MQAPDISVKQDAHVSTMLVNDHQTRFGGRQDIVPFELQINRLHISQRQDGLLGGFARRGVCAVGRRIGTLLLQSLAFLALEIGKQFVPVAHRAVLGHMMPRLST